MRRRTFDTLAAACGLILAVVLAVAGGLLMWGHSFADSQVSAQLSAQKIMFPAKGDAEFTALPAADQAAMGRYAGQELTTGAQAKVYADNFIAYHLSTMGGTYAQLSVRAQAQPGNAKLQGLVETVFKGTTLRSMLLEAYAFWEFGQIALAAAIVSFAGAVLLLLAAALGFGHARLTSPARELLARGSQPGQPAAAS